MATMDQTPRSLLARLCQPIDASQTAADWASFVELFTPLVYGWARGLGLKEPDAADLVQDVFVQLLRVLPTFRHDGQHSFRAWLATVLRNRWRDRCRRPSLADRPGNWQYVTGHADEDPANLVASAEYESYLRRRVLELLQRDFQPSTWQAFWKCIVEERTPAAVAAELGLSVDAVYKAIRRVRQRLLQELEGFLD
jgi:RNA polymerase sigma-70 factor (ECF subfamily)